MSQSHEAYLPSLPRRTAHAAVQVHCQGEPNWKHARVISVSVSVYAETKIEGKRQHAAMGARGCVFHGRVGPGVTVALDLTPANQVGSDATI